MPAGAGHGAPSLHSGADELLHRRQTLLSLLARRANVRQIPRGAIPSAGAGGVRSPRAELHRLQGAHRTERASKSECWKERLERSGDVPELPLPLADDEHQREGGVQGVGRAGDIPSDRSRSG